MKQFLTLIKKHPWISLVIASAWVLTLIPIIFDGQTGCVNETCGFIVGSNYRDGIWFQAVAETSFRTFPFQMPNFAGELLRGYHYLPNVFAYLLTFLGIPVAFTLYKIIPLLYMTGITLLGVRLARTIQKDKRFVGIFLFFLLFGMHLSLLTSLYHHGEIRNGALINTFQATRILESPHVALALLGLFFVVLRLYRKSISLRDRIAFSLILFLTMGTKFYVAFSLGIILGMYELILFFKFKKFPDTLMAFLLYGVSAGSAILLFYDPFSTSASGSIFTFAPFVTTHHMIESPDLFYMQGMVLARYFLYEAGWSPRLVGIELLSTALFFIYYFGARVLWIMFFFSRKMVSRMKAVEVACATSILLSMGMTVGFLQKGDWFNTIQFSVPAAYLSVIFLSQSLFAIVKKHTMFGYAFIFSLVLLTLPAQLINLTYLQSNARFVLPQAEVDALAYLKEQPPGSVFAPQDEHDMAYVSAFSGKPGYLNYVSHLGNAGFDSSKREALRQNFQSNIDEINTDYLYFNLKTHPISGVNECISRNYTVIYDMKNVRMCKKISRD